MENDGTRKQVSTEPERFDATLEASAIGAFVRYKDYAALKQSYDACVKALANVKKELQASGNWDARDYGWPSNRKAIDAALAAARALTEGR